MPRMLSEYRFGSMLARYLCDDAGRVSLLLIPAALRGSVVERRASVSGVEVDAYARSRGRALPAWGLDSLIQVRSAADDESPAFASGRTLRNSATVSRLRLLRHGGLNRGKLWRVRTTLVHEDGWRAHHDLRWRTGDTWLESTTTVENTSSAPLTLEMLSSFSLDGVTPFSADDAPGRLLLHRFRSVWSMEGRIETQRLEDLQLERSWVGWGVRCERFGVVGSMPVNGWFPRVFLEDRGAGVVWGAQLVHNASWQMEIYRRGDTVAFSGGLADREFGHWWKTLAPGESLCSPPAHLVCVAGTRTQGCDALNAAQEGALRGRVSRREASLPVVVNEWATSWGKPSHESLLALAPVARGLGARYLVIDAGWYAPENGAWGSAHGDWIVNRKLFPLGLEGTAKALREQGLVPGLWFELETCGRDSARYGRLEGLLHRSGRPITTGARRHLDLRGPGQVDAVLEKIVRIVRAGGFGYLKIDYNDTLGIGPDGPESPGEELRKQARGVHELFRRLRRALPGVVVENCSSGGHRLEPSMMALTEMSSISDAHECRELPVIAANLHELVLPRKAQIWAVLRKGEGAHRTVYSLAAAFLGRLCLSGDLLDLAPGQARLVREAVSLYRRASSTIRNGTSTRHGPPVTSYGHAAGWQAVLRLRGDARALLVVLHTFAAPGAGRVSLPLPVGRWRIRGSLVSGDEAAKIGRRALSLSLGGEWRGQVWLLEREPGPRGSRTRPVAFPANSAPRTSNPDIIP